MTIIVEPLRRDFAGQTVAIIGGGCSLMGFDFSKIIYPTIGCNKAAFIAKTDILFSMDKSFHRLYADDIKRFSGKKIFALPPSYDGELYPDAQYIERRRNRPLSLDPRYTFGSNSGFAAMNAAFLMGAKEIHLYGFDMQNGSQSHFHDGYKFLSNCGRRGNKWAEEFEAAAKILDKNGVKVLNFIGNPKSLITCFPTKALP